MTCNNVACVRKSAPQSSRRGLGIRQSAVGLVPVLMSGAGGRAEHRARGKWALRQVHLSCCQVAPVPCPEHGFKTGPAGCRVDWLTTAGRQLRWVNRTATTRLAVQVQGRQPHARLALLASALCTSGGWGSVSYAPVLLPHVPHNSPPQHPPSGTGSPGLAIGQAVHHPPIADRAYSHGPAEAVFQRSDDDCFAGTCSVTRELNSM